MVIGLRLFSNYRKLIWLLVSCLAVAHFSVQRKFMLEVWKANNPLFIFQRNASKSFYGRYYFCVMLALIVTYKLLTVESLIIVFFGTLWYSTIVHNLTLSRESYRVGNGYILLSTLQFGYFPVYMRGCP